MPHDDNPARHQQIPGVVVHRSRTLPHDRHPVLAPPRTRVEQPVLDLIDGARNLDEAYDWICRAVGRRRTTVARIQAALAARARIRWRREIELALGYAGGGALSVLATRPARVRQPTGNRYLDNLGSPT